MAGGRQLQRVVAAERQQLSFRVAGQRHLHAAVGLDQCAAGAQIGRVQHGAHGHLNEIRIRHIEVAVRECQAPGFGKVMHGLDGAGREAGHRKLFQLAQHLQHGDRAAARRRHAAQSLARSAKLRSPGVACPCTAATISRAMSPW
ncbi:hypothetical protein G6F22_019295 [Rhizopus arrhizus]|nr:hypothetical protein G6F22_019295 [Rhizopus arrhizus]